MKKAAAGAMFLVACGESTPPPGTENLTEKERTIITADLERAELQSGFVKELLDRADPMMGLNGMPQQDNDHMKELVDSVLTDGRWYLENDHFLLAEPNKVDPTSIDELAPGIRSKKNIKDNYLVIVHDEAEEGEFSSRLTGEYMHELARFHYPLGHVLVSEEQLVKTDPIVGEIIGNLYSIDQVRVEANGEYVSVLDSTARFEDALAEIQDWHALHGEGGAGAMDESIIEVNVRNAYEGMTEYLKLSEPAIIQAHVSEERAMIEWAASMVSGLGITEDEYRDALRESPELFHVDKERVTEMMSELTELYPEYTEGTEGGRHEKRSEPRAEWHAVRR